MYPKSHNSSPTQGMYPSGLHPGAEGSDENRRPSQFRTMTEPFLPAAQYGQPVQPVFFQGMTDQSPRLSLIRRAVEYSPQDMHGRKYHGFHRGVYMLPCDEQEIERLDLIHHVVTLARGHRLIHRPFHGLIDAPGPDIMRPTARILDLGCGTGFWAIEMARYYRTCAILGVDLAAIQPANLPPNVDILPHRDYEDPWFLGEDSWDMIRLSMGAGSVKSWENLYRKVHAHLQPGTGYFEQVEIDFEPRWDSQDPHPQEFTPDQPLGRWWSQLKEATQIAERPIAHNRNTEHLLKAAGFVDVEHHLIGLPLNPWSFKPGETELGRIYNLAFRESLYPLALAPLCRALGYTPDEVARLAADAYKQASDRNCRAFNIIHIYTARKAPVGV